MLNQAQISKCVGIVYLNIIEHGVEETRIRYNHAHTHTHAHHKHARYILLDRTGGAPDFHPTGD